MIFPHLKQHAEKVTQLVLEHLEKNIVIDEEFDAFYKEFLEVCKAQQEYDELMRS